MAAPPADSFFIRVNQLGYLPESPKTAVICALTEPRVERFSVIDLRGRTVFRGKAQPTGSFAACKATFRLNFSALRTTGDYLIVAHGVASPIVHVTNDAYRGAADTLLAYMRQQRSGYNPFFRDSVHKKDALLVDHPARTGEFIPVSGGWADAADYLQYVTTSANATFVMLQAYRDYPKAFGDRFDARGLPGRNGVPDVVDEARHGLEWLLRMFPSRDLMLNQLADDRDHAFFDLPVNDSSDYGWGRGGFRPVYPCTGKPQGLFQHKNRANGYASTAGKYAAAFALGAGVLGRNSELGRRLHDRAVQAYEVGRENPGVCQTAPGRSPYFYEEGNWVDDMELGAAELFQLTGSRAYLAQADGYARQERVTPWMGADTARHYEWYPWHNNGHYEMTIGAPAQLRAQRAADYRAGLARVVARANNGFRVGIPFIWCSNNLMVSFATQALLYRKMTGDRSFEEYELAALDWLFGTNPWGTSMVIGLPQTGRWPRDPHSVVAVRHGVQSQLGGLVDGPVYRSIYQNLLGIRLHEPDEYAALNTGFIVYHDDLGDYSTNEPIMDGTANLTYLLAAYAR